MLQYRHRPTGPGERRSSTRAPRGAALPLLAVLALALLPPSAAALDACTAVRVHDGDTLTLRCGQRSDHPRRIKVRIWGIDAPELAQDHWGYRARDRLRQLARGTLRVQPVGRDDYGRTVGRVYRDAEDLGLALVREGYAAVYHRYNDDPAYLAAARDAKRSGVGIWTDDGLQRTPWAWRQQHPEP
jgi:micrococcal nuclease